VEPATPTVFPLNGPQTAVMVSENAVDGNARKMSSGRRNFATMLTPYDFA
jgi:hypothetical protein